MIDTVVTVSARSLFSAQLTALARLAEEAARQGGWMDITPARNRAGHSLFVHRECLRHSLEVFSKAVGEVNITEQGEDVLIIKLPRPLPEELLKLCIGRETFKLLNACKFERGTLFITEYLAIFLFQDLALALKSGAEAARSVIFDDEARQTHVLFSASGKYYCLKFGDAGAWLHGYDNREQALEDYYTTDYGWEDWTPAQNEVLPVKPVEERVLHLGEDFSGEHGKFKGSSAPVQEFVWEYGVHAVLSAKIEETPPKSEELSDYIGLCRSLLGWTVGFDVAIGKADAPPLSTVIKEMMDSDEFKELQRKKRERETLLERRGELHRKKFDLLTRLAHTFRGQDGKVLGKTRMWFTVLFSSSPPVGEDVIMEEFEERISRHGKKYFKCFKWSRASPVLEAIDRELGEIEKKLKEV